MWAWVSRSWGRARNALVCAALVACSGAAVQARVGAESHLAPRRCAPCAHSHTALWMWETNSHNTMATKKELPPTTAQDWLRKFNASALYKHEPSRLFEDYLDLVLCAVANRQREERYLEVAKRYTKDELVLISELFAYHVLIQEHQTAGGGWYDMLGDIYMEMAGRSKTSRMGQFFTPAEVCTMMAQMTLDGDTAGKTVQDCCAGSGRMLLAAYAMAPDLGTLYAADLDGICVKMCALNFWLHGIRGEVAHMNSLSLEWYGAYHTHPNHSWPFVTYLDESRKEECHQWVNREVLLMKAETPVRQAQGDKTVPDLFNQVSEPVASYGEEEEDPFLPCELCGRVKSDTVMLLNGRTVEPWQLYGDEHAMVCTGCGLGLRSAYPEPEEHRTLAAEQKQLYGEALRAHTYLKNDARMVLDRLQDLHVVLHRHKCIPDYTGMNKWQKEQEDQRVEQAFVESRKKIALELRLRNAELVHDSIKCRIGNATCTFRFSSLPALIRTYRSNLKSAA
jgi:type I restriction enzyme M protein